MKTFSEETRRRMSESAKRRCTPEARLRMSKVLSLPLDSALVCQLYEKGLTMEEIANRLGCSRKPIENVLKHSGVSRRKAVKRNQWGRSNHMWRGDEASMAKLHARVDRRFGQPKKCSVCGLDDPSRHYDWANLTGHYTDVTDFKRMCRPCHRKYDNARRKSA